MNPREWSQVLVILLHLCPKHSAVHSLVAVVCLERVYTMVHLRERVYIVHSSPEGKSSLAALRTPAQRPGSPRAVLVASGRSHPPGAAVSLGCGSRFTKHRATSFGQFLRSAECVCNGGLSLCVGLVVLQFHLIEHCFSLHTPAASVD